jgi:hypothetical protein
MAGLGVVMPQVFSIHQYAKEAMPATAGVEWLVPEEAAKTVCPEGRY